MAFLQVAPYVLKSRSLLGRFFQKLQARNDQTGFNFPTGIAVMAPTGVAFGDRTCQGKEDDFQG